MREKVRKKQYWFESFSRDARYFEENGKRRVRIGLSDGESSCVLDASDYSGLRLKYHLLGRLFIVRGARGLPYVRTTTVRGEPVTIARLIVGAGPGQVVKYRDGDRFNLRRENLYVTEGRSKRTPSSYEPESDSPTKSEGKSEKAIQFQD